MPIRETDYRLSWRPLSQACVNPSNYTAIRDHWWAYQEDKGVLFFKVGAHYEPQALPSEEDACRMVAMFYPYASVRQVPVVFMPPR